MAEFFEYSMTLMPSLLLGARITLMLFLLTLVFAIPLGLPIALGSMSKIAPIRVFCRTYVWLFRGTPLLLQLYFFYFMLPISFGIALDAFPTAVITFVLNYAAYFAEIYRGGIGSIDNGQYEAAGCLGLTPWQTMSGIILPQTVKRVLPAVSNETITLVKDTALVSVISVSELMKAARGAVNRDMDLTAFFLAACIYLVLSFILTKLTAYLEVKFSKHENKGGVA